MANSGNWYANALDQAFSANINWASDTINVGLLGSGYTPNLATHIHWSDVSAQEITGTGYTAGGTALGTKTHTVTAANSFGTSWAASTAYPVGSVIRPATGNGFLYMASKISGTGTSGASTPTFPTAFGDVVIDNSGANQIQWTNIGESITQWSSANPSWSTATITASYAVIYKSTGTGSTSPLISLLTISPAASSTAATFTITAPSLGWFWWTPA